MSNIKESNYIFFLGGMDGEMIEIKLILKSQNYPYHNKNLSWGASLSMYEDELKNLSDDQVPVLIELKPDIFSPEDAIIIDHHDEKAGKNRPTSLEQIAVLIGITLDRRQQLISANDRGHIRAMMEMGATSEEIEDIRAYDRKAQGVSSEDEALAEKSIREHKEYVGKECIIIHSLTNRTSCIADRLYGQFDHLFIFTPDGQLTYYGRGDVIRRLIRLYEHSKNLNSEAEYWSGGNLPEFGFLGANTIISHQEVKQMVEGKIISNHIFMFPFTITENPRKIKADGSDFMSRVSNTLASGHSWKIQNFEAQESNLRYSEYVYFHHFVRDALYNNEDTQKGELPLLNYYVYNLPDESTFSISLYHQQLKKSVTYILDVKTIALRIYDTRIGILSFELENRTYDDFDDILKINDYGRRIYPQFMGETGGIADTKNFAFLPEKVVLNLGKDPKNVISEDFCENFFKKNHFVVASYIDELLGNHFSTESNFNNDSAQFHYKPTIDDRMFTVCWCGHDAKNQLFRTVSDQGRFNYETSDDWYRFLFLDGNSCTCPHPQMKERLINEATYERWISGSFATFLGVSRYSLMCLTDTDSFGYGIIRQHMRRHYAQMAALLLAQRASILRFSEEVTDISRRIKAMQKNPDREIEFKRISLDTEMLHAAYIRFVNRLWFTEITPQEQGIEMYEKAIGIMHLKQDMQDLKAEIKELYEFMSNSHDRSSNQQMFNLTVLGSIFLPLVTLTGFFGMNLLIINHSIWDAVFGQPDQAGLITEASRYYISTNYQWLFSLTLFLVCFYLFKESARGILYKLEGENSPILKYLTLRYWWKAFRGKQ